MTPLTWLRLQSTDTVVQRVFKSEKQQKRGRFR